MSSLLLLSYPCGLFEQFFPIFLNSRERSSLKDSHLIKISVGYYGEEEREGKACSCNRNRTPTETASRKRAQCQKWFQICQARQSCSQFYLYFLWYLLPLKAIPCFFCFLPFFGANVVSSQNEKELLKLLLRSSSVSIRHINNQATWPAVRVES